MAKAKVNGALTEVEPWEDDETLEVEAPTLQRTLDGKATRCVVPGCGHTLADHRAPFGDHHWWDCRKCKGDRNMHQFAATKRQVPVELRDIDEDE